jgi:hypothetical protein
MRTAFRSGAALASALFAAAIPNAAVAGYRIVKEDGETMLVSGGRYKSVSNEPGKPGYVFDVNKGRMMMSAPSAKAYWEGTIEEFCKEFPKAMEQGVAAMAKEMQKQQDAELAKLPPAERAKRKKAEADMKKWADEMNTPAGQAKAKKEMEEMARKMGVDPKDLDQPPEKAAANGPMPKINVEKTGDTATLAGIAARKWQVRVEGEKYEDYWLATDSAFLRELAWDKSSKALDRFQGCMETNKSQQPQGFEDTKEYRQLQAQGFPLKVVAYDSDPDGRVKEQVTSAERRDVPESEFAPPAGYKKTTLAALSTAWMTDAAHQQK